VVIDPRVSEVLEGQRLHSLGSGFGTKPTALYFG
jgi:hypothetical protein